MPRQHIVENGDSVESIAYANGHFWETVWNDPANTGLREKHTDPNILEEGDVVAIPDLRSREESAMTDAHHQYRLRGVPSKLRVRFLDSGEPRSGLAYTVTANDRKIAGVTDQDGWVDCYLMPDVVEGMLRIDSTEEEYPFRVGTVRPPKTVRGFQTRLQNLGYYDGAIDNEVGDELAAAVRMFQRDQNLPSTGEFDDATRGALVDEHGS